MVLGDGIDVVAIEPAGIIDVAGDITRMQRPGPGGLAEDNDIQAAGEKEAYEYETGSAEHF
jgi:hypothetical protein